MKLSIFNTPILHKIYKNEKWNVSKFEIYKYNDIIEGSQES